MKVETNNKNIKIGTLKHKIWKSQNRNRRITAAQAVLLRLYSHGYTLY